MMNPSNFGLLMAVGFLLAPQAIFASTGAASEGQTELSACESSCILTVARGNSVKVLMRFPNGKTEHLHTFRLPPGHSEFRDEADAGSVVEVKTHVFLPPTDSADAGACSSGHDGYGWDLSEIMGSMTFPDGAIITSLYIGVGQQLVTTELPDGSGTSVTGKVPMRVAHGCVAQG